MSPEPVAEQNVEPHLAVRDGNRHVEPGRSVGTDDDSYEQVIAAIELLVERGPQLGRPIVDTVTESRHKNMKELRPGSAGRSELRALFAFDPRRKAIFLIGGDKTGNWKRWYKTNIPIADDRFDEHLEKLKNES